MSTSYSPLYSLTCHSAYPGSPLGPDTCHEYQILLVQDYEELKKKNNQNSIYKNSNKPKENPLIGNFGDLICKNLQANVSQFKCLGDLQLMAAHNSSLLLTFRCCVRLRVRVSRGRNRCEPFRSKTPTGGAAFSRLLVLVPIVSCSKRFGFVSCSGAFSRLLVQDGKRDSKISLMVDPLTCLMLPSQTSNDKGDTLTALYYHIVKPLTNTTSLDKSCLGPLRKAYCSSLNLLLRHEAREFANELRAITKASRNPTVLLEGSTGSNQNVNNADTSTALNNMPKCSPYLSHSFLMSPAGLITCMTQGTTSLLSNTVYAISDAATQDQVPENDVKGISKDKPLIHQEQEKHKQFLGFLVPYYKPAEYISLLVTYAGNNLVERTYESDINGNKFNTRVHTIRC
uniref:Uncharacterized protein n=1 Tax=Lactuca sativa TaxID=4236 RepID=A0A9R1V5U4_LACSA|nr:hypothetical protein LSAT_V11C600326380 [Lactuca sativa]